MPIVNRHREEHRVDFHWPAYRLIVETDGRGIHDNPYAFEEDRRRDLDLELADWHVIRLTWRQSPSSRSACSRCCGSGSQRLEAGREVPQRRRLLDDPEAAQLARALGDVRHTSIT